MRLAVEKGIWSFDYINKAVVDPISGIVYKAAHKIESGNHGFYLSADNESILLPAATVIPSQFSVFESKAVYLGNNHLYWKNQKGLSDWSQIGKNGFNPCDRFQKGLYRLDKGVLSLNFFY